MILLDLEGFHHSGTAAGGGGGDDWSVLLESYPQSFTKHMY